MARRDHKRCAHHLQVTKETTSTGGRLTNHLLAVQHVPVSRGLCGRDKQQSCKQILMHSAMTSPSCRSQAGQAAHASPDAAGAVQKELAGFLKGCPGGVVALDNAQKLHPALLPVFINALSEQGSFEVHPLSCARLCRRVRK